MHPLNFCINFILFMLYSIFGWICEEIVPFDPKKGFINRGFLLGPYCPIYGCGVILITLLLQKYADDVVVTFFLSVIIPKAPDADNSLSTPFSI